MAWSEGLFTTTLSSPHLSHVLPVQHLFVRHLPIYAGPALNPQPSLNNFRARCKRDRLARKAPLTLHLPLLVRSQTGTMGGRQVQKWDPSVHEDILISLFQHLSLSAGEWAALMNDMQAKGYTFTEGALRYALFLCFLHICGGLALHVVVD